MMLYVVATLLVTTAQADIFSSTAHLQNLLHLERHLVTTLHNYIDRTEMKLSQVKRLDGRKRINNQWPCFVPFGTRYLNLFYDSYQDVLEDKVPVPSDGEDMVANPLQAYQLVKRLAVDWNFIKSAMSTDDWFPVRKLIRDYRQLMPKKDDLQGAALALVRLQDTYKLNMTDVARGDVLGVPQGTTLTGLRGMENGPSQAEKALAAFLKRKGISRDLLYLGKQSFNAGYYAHAIRWLEEALSQAHLEGNRTASVAEINAFYQSAIEMHDRLFELPDINLSDYDTFGYPLHGNLSLHRAAVATGHQSELGPDISVHDEQANYMALCRGERLRSTAEESKLFCRTETRNHPYLLLRPLRIEERSLKPYVVVFHDLLTENQTEILRLIAEPKLARSMVQASKGSEIVSVSRTSQNAWVGPTDHPLMANVYRLVEAVTGLSTDVEQDHAEIVQIANYGMGGHYTPHFDYLLVDKDPEELQYVHPKELDAGDRTATLMFYLSDVTRGGATVFPKVGASVWPKRGSAVFWYNLKQSGKEDALTLHGACPVAIGSKWVANFWIREKGQVFRRRCALDADL